MPRTSDRIKTLSMVVSLVCLGIFAVAHITNATVMKGNPT